MKYLKSITEVNEAVEVKTNRYERSHGKKPRGYGKWAFYFDDRGGDPIFTPTSMSYTDAVKWAKEQAKKEGRSEIYVGESVELNEGEALIFDVVEPEFNDLKTKLQDLYKKTIDPKWRQALDKIQHEVDKLEFFISKFDKQLGAIETNESVNEAWFGPFQFNDKMSDDVLKKMYDEALSGYSYWQRGFEYPKSDYKKAYQEIEKILKKRGVNVDESLNEREYSDEERKDLAKKGLALPDGSFPIKDLEDLKNAIKAYGRAKDQAATAKFIVKRAKALGADDLIPDTEDFQKSLKEELSERNAFLGARAKAIEEDADEFEFNGKKYPVLKRPKKLNEDLNQKEVLNILDAAAMFADDAHVAANQMWKSKEDLIDYLLSDHIPKKHHNAFLKYVK